MNENMMTGVYTIDDEDVQFVFLTSLSAYKKAQFVASVSDILVGDNYNYVIKDIAFDFCVIAIFTDIDTSDVQEAADGITAMEEFVNKFKAVIDIVKTNVKNGVMDELEKAIELNIEYRTGIHINPISSSLSSLLDTIERKFDGIDVESLMNVAESMAGISGELTAEKMLDAYAKTDIFKKNWGNTENNNETINVADNEKKTLTSPILSPII